MYADDTMTSASRACWDTTFGVAVLLSEWKQCRERDTVHCQKQVVLMKKAKKLRTIFHKSGEIEVDCGNQEG